MWGRARHFSMVEACLPIPSVCIHPALNGVVDLTYENDRSATGRSVMATMHLSYECGGSGAGQSPRVQSTIRAALSVSWVGLGQFSEWPS